ncbi:hypothetical protein J5S49_04895 [Virgibacillus halodenitrificans]|uniref:hypothetical protein n=1 Tax=Virgibacillus halodenitrificans TaxID=1482 RepID=UPI001F475947|nr:hypothetical protein [Virgibacillus halodenitrificans]MCG1027619.1 hypothetical protein [Virgibacillus halodenitrificans]
MEQFKELDLDDFEVSECKDKKRLVSTGGFSIIHSKNGNRVILNANKVLSYFPQQDSVQIAYSDKYLAVADFISDDNTNYMLNKIGKNGVIYNTALVHEIVRRYELDFSSCTSQTFQVYNVQEMDNGTVVFIDMKPNEEA